MLQRVFAFLILGELILAQPGPPSIPKDMADDAYAIYSAVLEKPKLSHKDDNQKYLVLNTTTAKPFREPAGCVQPPEAYRASFAEIAADYLGHKDDSFQLERKLSISKPYELIDQNTAKQFESSRMSPRIPLIGGDSEPDQFPGAIDLFRLGNVYFNRPRTLAAVSTEAWCGGLCALATWRIFEKKNGRWTELSWNSCVTVSQNALSRSAF